MSNCGSYALRILDLSDNRLEIRIKEGSEHFTRQRSREARLGMVNKVASSEQNLQGF